MFFAHEMTHVWQWQNRDLTGYHPFRAFAEHAWSRTPISSIRRRPPLSRLRLRGAGLLVEEYVCCRAVDPRAHGPHGWNA
jgi:hypothetical protein